MLSQGPEAHRAEGSGDPDSVLTPGCGRVCAGRDPVAHAGPRPSLPDLASAPQLAGAPGEQLVIFCPERHTLCLAWAKGPLLSFWEKRIYQLVERGNVYRKGRHKTND